MSERLWEAKELAEAGKYSEAWKIVAPHLDSEPNDPKGLLLATFMLEKQGQTALAYQICKGLTQQFPQNAIAWVNLGKCCDSLWRMDEAEAAYHRALTQLKAGDNETKLTIYTNLSALFLQLGQFEKARTWAEKALKIDPGHLKARHNMGLCLMAAGEWSEGWKQYEASVGSPQRIAWNYGGEPVWKGEPGGTVVAYGEQGIGDEICAASMFDDAIANCGKLIIDCDARLEKIFARSFPKARVYGTRNAKILNWDEADHKVDHSIASMQLGSIFRRYKDSFPNRPYLKADPERVLMWRALWKDKGKPAIGIAWTGGVKQTGEAMRSFAASDYAPLFGIDAHFVSLQYKDASEEIAGLPITQYRETLSKDYDETASLVASLDAVVSVPTSVVHLSGALGVPTVAMKAPASCWKYAAGLPFHPRLLVENKGWPQTIKEAAKITKELVHGAA